VTTERAFAHPTHSSERRATLPSPDNSIITWSPTLSHMVLTRLPVSTNSPARRAVAVGGEMIGEPGQRVVGMAEHVGAACPAPPHGRDEPPADHRQKIRHCGSRHGVAEHAAAAKKSSATKVGAPRVCQSA